MLLDSEIVIYGLMVTRAMQVVHILGSSLTNNKLCEKMLFVFSLKHRRIVCFHYFTTQHVLFWWKVLSMIKEHGMMTFM